MTRRVAVMSTNTKECPVIDQTVQTATDQAALEAVFRALPAHIAAMTDALNQVGVNFAAMDDRLLQVDKRLAAVEAKVGVNNATLQDVRTELEEAREGFVALKDEVLARLTRQPTAPAAVTPVVPAPPAQPVVQVAPAPPTPAPAAPVVVREDELPAAAPAATSILDLFGSAFKAAASKKES